MYRIESMFGLFFLVFTRNKDNDVIAISIKRTNKRAGVIIPILHYISQET